MAVYYISSYDITNEQEFSKYIPLVRPLLQKHGAQVIVADFNAIALEGMAKKMNAVVRFPSQKAAMDYYNDPDYEPARQVRLKSTSNCTIIVANEWVPTV